MVFFFCCFFIEVWCDPVSGSRSMLSFEGVRGGNGSNRPFFRSYDHEDNGDEDLEDYFHQPEKKRRLTVDQVQFLEKSFEVDNKLEPERKTQLAKDLSLQPRQVAIWFQNRRARWKTKQLEKDYEVLQASYDSLKADYDNLLKERNELKAEVNIVLHNSPPFLLNCIGIWRRMNLFALFFNFRRLFFSRTSCSSERKRVEALNLLRPRSHHHPRNLCKIRLLLNRFLRVKYPKCQQ
jgi:hypothetical protein